MARGSGAAEAAVADVAWPANTQTAAIEATAKDLEVLVAHVTYALPR